LIQDNQTKHLGGAGRLVLVFDFDRVPVRQEDSAGRFLFDIGKNYAASDFGTHGHWIDKPDFVHSIIDAHLHLRIIQWEPDALAHRGNEGKRQKALRDGSAKGSARGAFDIHMNPLMVLGTFGKLVDAILIYENPIAYADWLTDQGPQLFCYRARIHEVFLCETCARCEYFGNVRLSD
jgi:hypothetical protein